MRGFFAVFLFILAGAGGAWAFLRQSRLPPPCIDVTPGAHQSIQSSDRGDNFIIYYQLTNAAKHDLLLSVTDKSCTCINVTIDRDLVKPGGRAEIALQGVVPLAGQTDGAARIIARPTDKDGIESGCEVTLSYVLESVRGSGVELVPRRIELPRSGPIPSKFAISLSSLGIGQPIGLALVDSVSGETVPFSWIMSWSDDRAGGYAAAIELSLQGEPSALAQRRIICHVECESGETAAAELEITWGGS